MNAKHTNKDKIMCTVVLSNFVCLFYNFSAVADSNFSDPEMLSFVN